MNLLTKWMTLLLSIVALGLAGCGESDKFYGDTSTTELGDSVAAYISVTALPNLVGTNEVAATDITATVYDQYGAGMSDVVMTFSTNSNSGGSFPVPVAVTGGSGDATISYDSGSTGGVIDTITVSGGGLSGTVDVGVQTIAAAIGSVTLSATPPLPLITAGTTGITIAVAIKDTNNAGVPNQPVTLVMIGDGSLGGSASVTLTTDSLGSASQALTVPTLLNTGSTTITAYVVSSSGTQTSSLTLDYQNDIAASMKLSASPAVIGGTDTSKVQVIVLDQYGNPVPGAAVEFSTGATVSTTPTFTNSSGFSAAAASVSTDASGAASIDYNANATIAGVDNIDASTSVGAVTNTFPLTITTVSVSFGGITIASNSPTVTADGTSATVVTAQVTDTSGQPMEGQTVTFSTTAGTLGASSALTDASGNAIVSITSGTNLATAVITATVGAYSTYTSVDFVAGPISSGVITALPATLPADGTTQSTITVALQDASGNPVTDGTTVTLMQDLATATDSQITSSNPTTTQSGRATFTLLAATSSGSDRFYLFQDNTIEITMTYGAGTSSGVPASILLSSDKSQISVAGVGKDETASVSVTVVDGTGTTVSDEVYDNVQVRLLASPNAGEYLSGTTDPTAPTPTTSLIASPMKIFTTGGSTSFGIQSGTLPGIVEIQVDVIDINGTTLISATVPQIVIASGPPESIVFSYPLTDAVVNLGGGSYQRKGSIHVADRYGNAVADGTLVNLGMIDTVKSTDTDGVTTVGGSVLTDANATFTSSTVSVQGQPAVGIQENDRVLLFNAVSGDKNRFVSASAVANTTVPVQTPYTTATTGLGYIIGGTVLSGTIAGAQGEGGVGYVQTTNGIGNFAITYPANVSTIYNGCTLDAPDTRTVPADAGDVYVVASASDSDATAITNVFCFSAIAGGSLSILPSVDIQTMGDNTVALKLVDGGDAIPLPFQDTTGYVVYDSKDAASTLVITATGCNTGSSGGCDANVNLSGTPVSGDSATVTFARGDITSTVQVTIP